MSGVGEDLFTAEERGQSDGASRILGRVLVTVGVAALVVGVVLAGNYVSVGTFLPWVAPEAEPSTALADLPARAAADACASVTEDQSDLVAAEDQRLVTLAGLAADDPRTLDELNTLVLSPRAGGPTAYSLPDLLATGALRQDDATTFTLTRNIVVRSGAELNLNAPGATVRLASSPAGYVSIVGWGGSVGLSGAEGAPLTLVAWDDATGGPDTDRTDGRAYVRVRDGGLAATDVRFENLGYWSGRTGGVAVTATDFGFAALALARTEHIGLHYGLFVSSLSGGAVTGATVTGSAMAGIEATNGTQDLLIDATTVTGSGGDGLSVTRASSRIAVTASTFAGSGGYGIRVDGRALAEGPSAGGYPLSPAEGVSVSDSAVRDNAAGGIRIVSVHDAALTATTVEAAETAVRIDGPARGFRLEGGSLSSTGHRGLSVGGDVSGGSVAGTRIHGPRIAVEVRSSTIAIRDAALSVDVGHVVELDRGARADVIGGTFAGTGQDAVVSLDGSRAVVRGNDASAWRFQFEFVAWMNDHPMMWMWALVLVIPVVGLPLLARRRRKHRELRRLLEQAIVRYGASQIAAYGADPAPDPEPQSPVQPEAPTPRPSRVPGRTPRPAPAAGPPRSFSDLRTGALAGREFESLQQFAVAAVLEAGYPIGTIASLFRIPSWRLQSWVQETVDGPSAASPRVRGTPRRHGR